MRVPILMYHQVSPDDRPEFRKYTVSPREFRRQVGWLRLAGYHSVGLAQLIEARKGEGTLPPRPVVITFDDGFAGCHEHAAPALASAGFTATFYLVAGLMGGSSSWLRAERGFEAPIMTWENARELQARGFTCGAHSMTHPRLATLPVDECRRELVESRELLEQHLGDRVEHLAYPFGSYDEGVRLAAIESGYRSAVSVRPGLSDPDDDPFALHRVFVAGTDTIIDFAARLRFAVGVRDLVRGKSRGLWSRVSAS
jgi:peptidoglycan/xylan/chitin deacetylase (PgdA/CDA1 family)